MLVKPIACTYTTAVRGGDAGWAAALGESPATFQAFVGQTQFKDVLFLRAYW